MKQETITELSIGCYMTSVSLFIFLFILALLGYIMIPLWAIIIIWIGSMILIYIIINSLRKSTNSKEKEKS